MPRVLCPSYMVSSRLPKAAVWYKHVHEVREVSFNRLGGCSTFVSCHLTVQCHRFTVDIRHPIIGGPIWKSPWKEISIEYEGKIISGDYRISGKTVVVRSVRGVVKEAPLGGLTPLYLAKMLLRELDREGRA